jgi:hypothetical protein
MAVSTVSPARTLDSATKNLVGDDDHGTDTTSFDRYDFVNGSYKVSPRADRPAGDS